MKKKQQLFLSLDYDHVLRASDLLRDLKSVLSVCPDAIVTIRQMTGTDFPPFLTIESPEEFNAQNESNVFENLLS